MQLTVRNVSPELRRRIEALSKQRGESMNSIILMILEQAVALDHRLQRLARYATWTDEDADAFDEALQEQRQLDEELWD